MTIHEAAAAGNVATIQKLLAAGTSVDARDEIGSTPLMLAVLSGQLTAVQALRAAGTDLHARNAHGYTALHFAAQSDRPDLVRMLIEAGLEPDERTAKDSTPLMVAAAANAARAAAVLIEQGADVNAVNALGKTALEFAKSSSARRVLEILKQAGAGAKQAQPSVPRPERKLWRAAEAGDTAKVRELLAAGVSPHVSLAHGENALKRAVAFGHLETALVLLEAGADPHLRDTSGNTLLHDAAWSSNVELVRAVLHQGLDVNAANKEGFTPLMAAAQQGAVAVVRVLLEAGADPNVRGNFSLEKNKTALQFIQTEDRKVRKALKDLLGRAGAPPDPAETAFEAVEEFARSATQPGFQAILQLLGEVCTQPPKPWKKCKGGYQCARPNAARLTARYADLEPAPAAADAEERAGLLLLRLQEEVRAAGFQLVRADATAEPDAAKLLLFPTADKYAVIAAIGTDGANYGHDTRTIIAWLHALEQENPFALTGCGGDFLAGNFLKPVVNPGPLAERMCAFCPDLIDGDMVESPAQVAEQLAQSGDLFFWWD